MQQRKILHAPYRPVFYQPLDRLQRMLSRFTNMNGDLARVRGGLSIVKKVDDFRLNVLKRWILHRLPRHRRVDLIKGLYRLTIND